MRYCLEGTGFDGVDILCIVSPTRIDKAVALLKKYVEYTQIHVTVTNVLRSF